MKTVVTRMLCASAILVGVVAAGAQERPAAPPPGDPRVGLKAGFKNPGVAASNMELVKNLPKPPGFFDPKEPAGSETEPEKPEETEGAEKPAAPPAEKPAAKPPAGGKPAAKKPTAQRGSGLNFVNSDMAFRGNQLFIGNFSGFNIYDIANPAEAQLIASVICPGGQGDVSIRGNLLIMSVEQTRGRIDCGTSGVEDPVSRERFRGIRIFDITELKKPRQLAAVQTCRGSHTHTLVEDPDDKANIYVYGSGTGTPRPAEELAGCSAGKPEEDPNTALFSIDVIQIPLASPEKARIVSRPRIFADPATGAIAGLAKKGDHGPGTQTTSETNQCHDITVFPALGLAAGACSGNGILLDISDPVKPVRLDAASDKNFAYWHSATFNNDGTKVIFTDEWGGGTRPRCRATDLPEWGANAIFDIVDRKLQFRSYYKLPAPQTEVENCVAHNGSLVPVPGRDIMVQGWYQGGVSVFDFTDSAKPFEIAYFDRGPVDGKRLITAGQWSAYWYNGHIYGAEMARGLDIFRLKPSEHLSPNELEAARLVHYDAFNPQQQPLVTFPAGATVARAYLDQLMRNNAIQPDRAAAVKAALDSNDRAQLATLAAQLGQDAAAATGRDAARLKALAETLPAK
ncbi:MAG TPA: hypothetical protein VJ813_07905 [Vicinamibacterales bacterium]|nr:hypothetical protein [Vicinamibacterales bacterium]